MAHPAYRGRRWIAVRLEILERDAWRCQLCGEAIDRDLPPGSHDRAGTADHVNPVATGGAWWDPRNLRAAHVACNRARGKGLATSRRYPRPRAW